MEPRATAKTTLKLVATRRMSGKRYLGLHLLMLLLAAGIAGLGLLGLVAGIPPPIFLALAAVPPILGWIYATMARRSCTYRLYTESLEVERGLLTRQIENLQLFRVRDVALRQGVFGRIFDVGDVLLTSTDKSNPHLGLIGIDDPRGFYRILREHVASAQAEKPTMIVEGEA